jgi:DNA-binding transcriptional regulator YhcF (GntR family)
VGTDHEKGQGPAYKQMMEQVIQQIEKGFLEPGQKLPAGAEIC